MATEREEQIEGLVREYRARLEQGLPEGPLDIHQIEDVAERVGQDVQQVSRSGSCAKCWSGAKAIRRLAPAAGSRFRGRYAQEIVTAAGKIRVRRAYYHCAACGQGRCPADARLALGPANTTPAAQGRLAVLAALVPYTQVNDVLAQLGLRLALDIKSTEHVAQRVGARVEATPPRLSGGSTRGVGLALDGVMPPTWDGYKETRVAVIYEPDWEAGRTPATEAGLRKEYFATTESRESLVRTACARSVERCGPGGVLSVLGDTAALDWADLRPFLEGKVAAWIEILDFYHVAERLGTIATAMFTDDAAQAAAWRAKMKQELLEFGPGELLRSLRNWKPTLAAAREVRREQLRYFEGQQDRMRYPDYLRRGLPIGSGPVGCPLGGACKHVVSDRFKGGETRWKLATTEPLLHLRAALLTQPRLNLRSYTATLTPNPAA